MRAGGFSPESVPSSKQSKTILKHQREPRASTYRAGLAHDRRPKNRPRRPVEVRARRSGVPSLRPVLRAPSGETQKPGGRCSRQDSNRHSCNDRRALVLRPSTPDAARTTSSAAKTAANQRNGRHRRRTPPRGTAQLAQGPPHRLRRAAAEQGGRVDGPAELGRRHPGQKRHDVGGLRVQPHDGVLERLPRHRTNRQVRVAAGPVPVSAFTRRRRRDASSTPSPRRLLEISHAQARSSGT